MHVWASKLKQNKNKTSSYSLKHGYVTGQGQLKITLY